jgi:hypothetical protein
MRCDNRILVTHLLAHMQLITSGRSEGESGISRKQSGMPVKLLHEQLSVWEPRNPFPLVKLVLDSKLMKHVESHLTVSSLEHAKAVDLDVVGAAFAV